jgi:cytochrome b subunit of formate dehydrogenase
MSEQLQERHALPERVFHWVMALTVVVCLATAFLPIIGLEFAWVDPHWIAGVLLTAAVLFHLWRVFFRLKLSDMWIYLSDLRELRSLLESNDSESGASLQKYDLGQKLYHWAVALLLLSLIFTGLFMLVKLDTWFWGRAPGILSDSTWGVVYTIHGAAALALITMFILHLYFSFLPEHRELLVSMVKGGGNINRNK